MNALNSIGDGLVQKSKDIILESKHTKIKETTYNDIRRTTIVTAATIITPLILALILNGIVIIKWVIQSQNGHTETVKTYNYNKVYRSDCVTYICTEGTSEVTQSSTKNTGTTAELVRDTNGDIIGVTVKIVE